MVLEVRCTCIEILLAKRLALLTDPVIVINKSLIKKNVARAVPVIFIVAKGFRRLVRRETKTGDFMHGMKTS